MIIETLHTLGMALSEPLTWFLVVGCAAAVYAGMWWRSGRGKR